MRVFAAFVPSESAIEHLVAQLGDDLGSLSSLTWADPDMWHLSLAFFGNISQRDLDRFDTAFEPVTKQFGPIDARLRGLSGFPDDTEANALCTEVATNDVDLYDVSRAVLKAVEGFGWVLDRRSFRPHVAIARTARESTADVRELAKRHRNYLGPTWVADTLAVLWAKPTESGGVTYEVVGAYRLRGE